MSIQNSNIESVSTLKTRTRVSRTAHKAYCVSDSCCTFMKKRPKHGRNWIMKVTKERVYKLTVENRLHKVFCPDCKQQLIIGRLG